MMKKNNGILFGAAMAASLFSALTTLITPKKEPQSWAEHARFFANSLVQKENRTKRNVVIGSIAGGLLGVATAVILAQRSGMDFVKPFKKGLKKTTTEAKKQVKRVAKKAKSTIKKATKKGKDFKVEALKHFG